MFTQLLGTQQYKGASPSLNTLWVVLLGIPNQMHFNTKLLHSVDHLSYYVCSAALAHNNIKVWKEHPSHWVLCEWYSARIPQSGAFQCKISAQCWPPVLLCVLSCFGTQQCKGFERSIPLTECFVSGILLGFPIQVNFIAKFLHSVDHLSYYVCSAALGHSNVKGLKGASLSLSALWVVFC